MRQKSFIIIIRQDGLKVDPVWLRHFVVFFHQHNYRGKRNEEQWVLGGQGQEK